MWIGRAFLDLDVYELRSETTVTTIGQAPAALLFLLGRAPGRQIALESVKQALFGHLSEPPNDNHLNLLVHRANVALASVDAGAAIKRRHGKALSLQIEGIPTTHCRLCGSEAGSDRLDFSNVHTPALLELADLAAKLAAAIRKFLEGTKLR